MQKTFIGVVKNLFLDILRSDLIDSYKSSYHEFRQTISLDISHTFGPLIAVLLNAFPIDFDPTRQD